MMSYSTTVLIVVLLTTTTTSRLVLTIPTEKKRHPSQLHRLKKIAKNEITS